MVYSCAVKKYVPEDELLLDGYKLEVSLDSAAVVKDMDLLKAELEQTLSPKPNAQFLGMRPGLHYYYKVNQDSAGFISRFLNRKIGEEPVYLSDVEEEATRDLIRNRLENRGFFFSNIFSEVERNEDIKEATVSYRVQLPSPYTLETYQIDRDSIPFYAVLENQIEDSPIQKGSRFDLSAMKLERERIDQRLKEKGYYNFNAGFLIFQADTNQYDNRKFDLFLKLKKDVPSKAVKPYKIDKVNIYPHNVAGMDTIQKDTTRFADKNYIQDKRFFRPDRLDPFVLIEEGDLYSPKTSKATSRRLGSIGAYKFVNIEYSEVDSLQNDTLNFLEANIYLSPLNKRAIRAELQGVTKSNDFAGPALGLTFSNRNLFRGGETLNINAKAAYEVQIASNTQAGLTSTEFGLGADLIFPRVLFPITIDTDYFEYSIPKTIISAEADLLNRSKLYGLLTFSGSFGYVWQANKYVTHEFDPISLNYVNLLYKSDEFQEILDDNPFLNNSFEQQFISGLIYSFTYNGMIRQDKKSLFFVNSTVDIAGNSISLLGQQGDPDPVTGDTKGDFLGLEYAQYAKADVDFRYHYITGKEQRIATRLFAGLGVPYGNSDVMPFSKQYFSGGAYSVRAFRTRSLGPGTYNPPMGDNRSFFDQSGNLRLEANVEYRFPIYSYLKGAVFADAGNVWNTSDDGLPGGKFSGNFINELGIGAGAGIRVDVQGFVIRFDLAAPLHDPSEEEGARWVNDFSNPVFNFAIGYPF
ncbi:hypothetical protein NMS_2631 [Nonlabens marinus S1-08]|uniref:Bacterial surface antigen (D15) domain-containing protein n=1 Tax=Nonlabens marinus S1-08 TaxID=1454201 RepID=W8VSZ4_9FLAO|nr:BamA/TamA family outer membrane protein [Nonlabens marinus]BAO56640.1 hypothetical protein NMS_2631 [Nonlabens marinus S1-08]